MACLKTGLCKQRYFICGSEFVIGLHASPGVGALIRTERDNWPITGRSQAGLGQPGFSPSSSLFFYWQGALMAALPGTKKLGKRGFYLEKANCQSLALGSLFFLLLTAGYNRRVWWLTAVSIWETEARGLPSILCHHGLSSGFGTSL